MPNPENLTPRKKGDGPLPGAGRPKGSLNVKTVLKKYLSIKEEINNPLTKKTQKVTQLELIMLKVMEQARKGNLNAVNLLLDRLDGKPEQKVQNEFPDGTEFNVKVGQPRMMQDQPPAEPETPTE